MGAWAYFLIGLVGCFLLVSVFRQHRREAAMKALATRMGLSYLGRGVPKSFSLSGTGLEHTTAIWNLIDGDSHGVRVMAFDCRVGAGKGSWRRTVIATDAKPDTLKATSWNPELIVERSGKWSVIYQPKTFSFIPPGLMPVGEAEAHLKAIAG